GLGGGPPRPAVEGGRERLVAGGCDSILSSSPLAAANGSALPAANAWFESGGRGGTSLDAATWVSARCTSAVYVSVRGGVLCGMSPCTMAMWPVAAAAESVTVVSAVSVSPSAVSPSFEPSPKAARRALSGGSLPADLEPSASNGSPAVRGAPSSAVTASVRDA